MLKSHKMWLTPLTIILLTITLASQDQSFTRREMQYPTTNVTYTILLNNNYEVEEINVKGKFHNDLVLKEQGLNRSDVVDCMNNALNLDNKKIIHVFTGSKDFEDAITEEKDAKIKSYLEHLNVMDQVYVDIGTYIVYSSRIKSYDYYEIRFPLGEPYIADNRCHLITLDMPFETLSNKTENFYSCDSKMMNVVVNYSESYQKWSAGLHSISENMQIVRVPSRLAVTYGNEQEVLMDPIKTYRITQLPTMFPQGVPIYETAIYNTTYEIQVPAGKMVRLQLNVNYTIVNLRVQLTPAWKGRLVYIYSRTDNKTMGLDMLDVTNGQDDKWLKCLLPVDPKSRPEFNINTVIATKFEVVEQLTGEDL